MFKIVSKDIGTMSGFSLESMIKIEKQRQRYY